MPILVVLGNPPYNGFAGLPAEEEAGLVEPYRTTSRPEAAGAGAERPLRPLLPDRRAVHHRAARAARHRLLHLQLFLAGRPVAHRPARTIPGRVRPDLDRLLNGDKYKTGKPTPGRQARPERLQHAAQPRRHPGRHRRRAAGPHPEHTGPASDPFPRFLGEKKRKQLLAVGCGGRSTPTYKSVTPSLALGLPFRPDDNRDRLHELAPVAGPFSDAFPGCADEAGMKLSLILHAIGTPRQDASTISTRRYRMRNEIGDPNVDG